MFTPEVLKSGKTRARRERALAVLSAALEAVDPANAIIRQVSLSDETLRIGHRPEPFDRAQDRLVEGQRVYDLGRYRNIYVIGGGKAGGSMAQAIEEILGQRVTAGMVNVKYGYGAETEIIGLNEAGHPIPDAAGMAGTKQMADLARQATADDLVICLISGGGSALMTLPVEGITLGDMKSLTDALLRCGATINEINAVRKHLSDQGGKSGTPGSPCRDRFPHPLRRGGKPPRRHRLRADGCRYDQLCRCLRRHREVRPAGRGPLAHRRAAAAGQGGPHPGNAQRGRWGLRPNLQSDHRQ